jgi:Cysteine-rich secretory protein family
MGALKRFAATITVAMLAFTAFAIAAVPAQASSTSDESAFVRDINHERNIRGKSTLVVYGDLVSVARQHSQDMANKGTIWHASDTPYKVSGWTVYGENVGMGGSEPDLHQAFMNSPEHRDNILDGEFNEVGVGVVWKNGTLYVTEIFVKRSSASKPAYTAPKPSYTPVASVSYTPAAASAPRAPKPAPKPAVPAQPRNVSVLMQLVGMDAQSVNPANGQALGV